MSKFTKFSHQKTSNTKEGRLNHFMRLKNRHTGNSFILVGPHIHTCLGGLAVEFQPLNHNEEKSNATKQVRKEQNVASMVTSAAKGSFNVTIANAPLKKEAVQVIQLSDSPQERAQTFYDQLPLISVYNGDRKFYTPTFIFPNVSIKDEESRATFLSKAEETKKEIAVQGIMEPRPRNKHLYCGVCKEPFEEYLGHIKGKKHQEKSKKSPFTQHIKTLELQMNVGAGKKERDRQMKKLKAREERSRKREESQKGKSEVGKIASQEKDEKQQKDKLQTQCKIQAKIDPRQSKTQPMSPQSQKQKTSKRKNSKKRQLLKEENSTTKSKRKKELKSDSEQSESSPSRSREKKPRKKASSKQKPQQSKKKRGRPSKKDLEASKKQQQLLPARKK